MKIRALANGNVIDVPEDTAKALVEAGIYEPEEWPAPFGVCDVCGADPWQVCAFDCTDTKPPQQRFDEQKAKALGIIVLTAGIYEAVDEKAEKASPTSVAPLSTDDLPPKQKRLK